VDQRESEVTAGYIQDANEEQPSVVAFNSMVAGASVVSCLCGILKGSQGRAKPWDCNHYWRNRCAG
jgi:hypothetical protein